MGMEVAGSDSNQVNVETMVEESKLHEKENGGDILEQGVSEPIKFGSHSHVTEEPVKGVVANVSSDDARKNATEEWPDQQVHSFYFVRCRPYEDPTLRTKLDQADREVRKRRDERFNITAALREKRSARSGVISQLKSLSAEKKQYNITMDEKRNVMKPLQEALGSLRSTNAPSREKGVGICSSEEELNELIQSLHYRMQHESIPLTEEKQLLREIKLLEGTREQVIANVAMRVKIQDSLGQKESIQEQVKLIGTDLDGVRKERENVRTRIKYLEDELKAIDKDIAALEEELRIVEEKRDKAAENLSQLQKKLNDGNSNFHQYRNLLNKARELAMKKDVKALEELCGVEVDNFISLWSSNKAYRDDYVKRMLQSLDMRQLSRDGRIRNLDEKPLVQVETVRPTEIETTTKAKPKPAQDAASKPTGALENLPAQKGQKEAKKKAVETKTAAEDHATEEEAFVVEKPQKEASKDKEIDPAKLKEIKREEEMAKQKQALERKKKLAEKSAAKAAARAQKEAEKKQKEREKKLKKKEATSGFLPNQDEQTGTEEEATEPEKTETVEENVENRVQTKTKEKESGNIRSRNRTKARDSLPKVILKRKKSNKYWMWAAAAAAAAMTLVVLALSYNYLF